MCPTLWLLFFSGIWADASLSWTWRLELRPTLISSSVGVTSLMRLMEHRWGIPRVDRYPSMWRLLNTVSSPSVVLHLWPSSFQAGLLLSRLKGCPLAMAVVRWRAQDGTVFRPLITLLQVLRLENPNLHVGLAPSLHPTAQEQMTSPTQCLKDGRQVAH